MFIQRKNFSVSTLYMAGQVCNLADWFSRELFAHKISLFRWSSCSIFTYKCNQSYVAQNIKTSFVKSMIQVIVLKVFVRNAIHQHSLSVRYLYVQVQNQHSCRSGESVYVRFNRIKFKQMYPYSQKLLLIWFKPHWDGSCVGAVVVRKMFDYVAHPLPPAQVPHRF